LVAALYAKKGMLEHELAETKTRIEGLTSLKQVGDAYMELEADNIFEEEELTENATEDEQLDAIRQDLLAAWEKCYECFTDPGWDGGHIEVGEYDVLLSAGISWGDAPTETYSAIVKLDFASVFNYPKNPESEEVPHDNADNDRNDRTEEGRKASGEQQAEPAADPAPGG